MMPFPDDLPEWARALSYVIVAVGIGIGVIVARFGLLQGRKASPESNPSRAQVAAVIVDPKALNAATDAVHVLNATLARLADLIGQGLVDAREVREERERDELVEAEVERRMAERARRRRPASRKKPSGAS